MEDITCNSQEVRMGTVPINGNRLLRIFASEAVNIFPWKARSPSNAITIRSAIAINSGIIAEQCIRFVYSSECRFQRVSPLINGY